MILLMLIADCMIYYVSILKRSPCPKPLVILTNSSTKCCHHQFISIILVHLPKN